MRVIGLLSNANKNSGQTSIEIYKGFKIAWVEPQPTEYGVYKQDGGEPIYVAKTFDEAKGKVDSLVKAGVRSNATVGGRHKAARVGATELTRKNADGRRIETYKGIDIFIEDSKYFVNDRGPYDTVQAARDAIDEWVKTGKLNADVGVSTLSQEFAEAFNAGKYGDNILTGLKRFLDDKHVPGMYDLIKGGIMSYMQLSKEQNSMKNAKDYDSFIRTFMNSAEAIRQFPDEFARKAVAKGAWQHRNEAAKLSSFMNDDASNKKQIDEDAKDYIAKYGKGSFDDFLMYLGMPNLTQELKEYAKRAYDHGSNKNAAFVTSTSVYKGVKITEEFGREEKDYKCYIKDAEFESLDEAKKAIDEAVGKKNALTFGGSPKKFTEIKVGEQFIWNGDTYKKSDDTAAKKEGSTEDTGFKPDDKVMILAKKNDDYDSEIEMLESQIKSIKLGAMKKESPDAIMEADEELKPLEAKLAELKGRKNANKIDYKGYTIVTNKNAKGDLFPGAYGKALLDAIKDGTDDDFKKQDKIGKKFGKTGEQVAEDLDTLSDHLDNLNTNKNAPTINAKFISEYVEEYLDHGRNSAPAMSTVKRDIESDYETTIPDNVMQEGYKMGLKAIEDYKKWEKKNANDKDGTQIRIDDYIMIYGETAVRRVRKIEGDMLTLDNGDTAHASNVSVIDSKKNAKTITAKFISEYIEEYLDHGRNSAPAMSTVKRDIESDYETTIPDAVMQEGYQMGLKAIEDYKKWEKEEDRKERAKKNSNPKHLKNHNVTPKLTEHKRAPADMFAPAKKNQSEAAKRGDEMFKKNGDATCITCGGHAHDGINDHGDDSIICDGCSEDEKDCTCKK